MTKTFLLAGSFFAGTAVILGAFGAHALKVKLSPEQLQIFETGVKYQMYHALAVLFLFLAGEKLNPAWCNASGWFFISGILLFSGSLYLLANREILGIENWKSVLGPITPLGGLSFVIGWALLLFAAIQKPLNS